LAYCGLADTYGWAGGRTLPGKAWAKNQFAQALELDPNLAERTCQRTALLLRPPQRRNSIVPWN
jgi:hypothetical protein